VRLAAVAVLAALALPLAGCQTLQGTAAYVGDTRISTDELNQQVKVFYDDAFWGKQVNDQNRPVIPRRTLRALIIREVFRTAVRNEGVDVTQADIATVAEGYRKNPNTVPQGFQGAPPALVAEIFARVDALQKKLQKTITSPEEGSTRLNAILEKALKDSPVDLNPRYGSFDASQFDLNTTRNNDAGVRDLPVRPSGPVVGGQPANGGAQPQGGGAQPQDGGAEQQPQN
jgi:hypothetical protein